MGTTPAETRSTPETPKDEVSLASALAIDSRLRDSLFKPLADYIETTDRPTLAGAQDFLTRAGVSA